MSLDSGAGNGHERGGRGESAGSSYPTSLHQDTRTWLEQIQFKAQYHHFRTNNYVAVVTAAAVLGQKAAQAPVAPPTNTAQQVDLWSSGMEEGSSGDGGSSVSPKPKHPTRERQRQSLCWNFPRVNIRKLFSVNKSMDELGAGSPERGAGASASRLHPRSASAVVGQGPRSSSSDSHAPTPTGALSLPTPTPARLSSSSAEDVQIQHRHFRYNYPLTPHLISNCSSEDNCSLSADPVPVPARSESPPVVNSTKSENCLNRMSTFLSPVTTNGHLTTPMVTKSYDGPIPTIVRHSPEPIKAKRRIHFNNQVEPGRTVDKDKSVVGERPRLVVASVAYLPRPVSPSLVTPRAWSMSDPSGMGMRSPATAGSRTPQALLSPTGTPASAGYLS